MDWKYITESDEVMLHDCLVTEWIFGKDITLNFEDGFDVCAANPLNDTGRHKRTGKSTVILKNASFISAEYPSYTVTHSDGLIEDIAAIELSFDDISKFDDAEILSSDYENGVFTLKGLMGEHDDFCRILLSCDKPLYCWNEFTDDAWFQDWNRENV